MHTVLGSDAERPGVLPGDAVGRGARPADGDRRRGDRAHLPRRCRRTTSGSRRSSAAARKCASSCALLTHAGLTGQGDPHARRLPPRPDAVGRGRLGDPRLRGRAGALARRAATQALAAARRRRDAPLVRVRVDAADLCAAAAPRGWEEQAARAVPRGLPRDGRPGAAAVRPGGDRPAARGLRAREGGLRAALRARQPAGMGVGFPSRGYIDSSSRRCTRDRARSRPASRARRARGRRRRRRRARVPAGGEVGARAASRGRRGAEGSERASGRRCSRRRSCRSSTSSRSSTRTASTYTLRDPYAFLPTLGELDLHLAMEGRHEELYERLGAHVREIDGVVGTAFAVWAPNARSRRRSSATSTPGTAGCTRCARSARRASGSSSSPASATGRSTSTRSARRTDACASRPTRSRSRRRCRRRTRRSSTTRATSGPTTTWLAERATQRPAARADVDLRGASRLVAAQPARGQPPAQLPGARRRARRLRDDLGFTHVELMPVMEHPFSGSWGYQVTGYFAPTSRFGSPDDFRCFVDRLHRNGVGVILDWVPGALPARRLGARALRRHARCTSTPTRGAARTPTGARSSSTSARNEVQNFLLSNALYWLREHHADGLRVDAVASMLYLDYSRKEGEWLPNEYGGRENLEAVEFLQADERDDLRRASRGSSPRRRSRRRGPASRGRRISAASASASSGTWAGCTTR